LVVADRILQEAALAHAQEDVHASLVLEQVLDRVLERAGELTGARRSAVRLVGADGRLRLAGAHATGPGGAGIDGALADRAAHERRTTLGANGAAVAVPLFRGDRLLGVLEVESNGTRLDDTDLELLRVFAVHAALAVHNSRLYEDALVALEHAHEPV
jgi:GAF domain-containing protein